MFFEFVAEMFNPSLTSASVCLFGDNERMDNRVDYHDCTANDGKQIIFAWK